MEEDVEEAWRAAGRAMEIPVETLRGSERVAVFGPRGPELRLALSAPPPPDERRASLEPLFGPPSHRASVKPGGQPRTTLRFDVASQGRWRAPALLEEALTLLGFPRAWPVVASGRALEDDELVWLELLPEGGVEIAWRHRGATELADARLVELSRVLQTAPLSTRVRFPAGGAEPVRIVELPLTGNDGSRLDACLTRVGADKQRYAGAFERLGSALPRRSLELTASRTRVEVAVLCEYGADARAAAVEPPLLEAEEIVRLYETDIILAQHPFLTRLRREPVNLGHLFTILANFWEAIVHDFPARLSAVVARLDDDRFRSVFAKQLNDELGEGDYTRAHKPMFRRMLHAVEKYRPALDAEVLLAPGRQFGRALHQQLFDGDMYQTVGALMIVEIYGKQVDQRVGEEFRRQNRVEDDDLTWLRLHETLEVDHADDSLRLAHLLPRAADGPDELRAVWRGAVGVARASQDYLNGLYRVCYR